MKYVLIKDASKVRTGPAGSISVTGSVVGMQNKFGWPKGGQVRIGSWIYNVGTAEMARIKRIGILRG